MNRLSFSSVGLEVLDEVAHDIVSNLGSKKIVLFYGEMGSGKTTLIKIICRQLGVIDSMSSPTFSLVNEYHTRDHKTIYHFDLYRIKALEECLDIGMDEYLESGNYCFVEWPEIAAKLFSVNTVKLFIEVSDSNHREIRIDL